MSPSRLPTLSGPDGLRVHVVATGTSYGCWLRFVGVSEAAALLVTKRGAILSAYPDQETLAVDYDLADLH